MIIYQKQLEELEPRYRKTFINSLAGFRQAVLVGTKSMDDNTNLAIFNSLVHLGADPALFGLISRPASVQRDTLKNIIETTSYTLNFIRATHYKKAHQTSARYNPGISEFEKVGLTPFYHAGFHAPFVEEALVKIAMKLEEIIPIPSNGTLLIVGSVMQVDIENTMVGPDGFVHLSSSEILISQGLDAYFISKAIGRLTYAKP
jgi:flavin reductase (DIM6/NTAB) family NADH-FMN oxidoreductase RutF